MPGAETVIQVEAHASPLSFYRWFCHPRVLIEDEVHHVAWGTHRFPVGAGSHTVEIFFKYLIMEKSGLAMAEVTVAEGETQRLRYSAPRLWQSYLAGGTIEGGEAAFAEPEIQQDLFASTAEVASGRVTGVTEVAPGRMRCTVLFGIRVSEGGRTPEQFLDILRELLLAQQGIEDVSIGAMARGQVDIELTVEAASEQNATNDAETALAAALLTARDRLK